MEKTKKVLIIDDSKLNRMILSNMLKGEFGILEAENGMQAITAMRQHGSEIALVLLDIVMPKMDGLEVLTIMNKYHWIEDIPVIMITSETASSYIKRAFELGVTDFINRPFDPQIVHQRVANTIMLYAKQKKLIGLLADQLYEKERNSELMITILSHIVEFRNGESGTHVRNIHVITELLLKQLVQKTDKYNLAPADIAIISTASALHDVGKIMIPEEVLNKPGKFTDEEFAIMKKHSEVGARMLRDIPFDQDTPLLKVAYGICRWHHERYDGRGYPDGLKGEEIPIGAQIVALADVYDALTSKRVYKDAFSHEKAIQMILNGECGAFNPVLLECLTDIQDSLRTKIKEAPADRGNIQKLRQLAEEMLRYDGISISERILRMLECEREKVKFLSSVSSDIVFEYTDDPPMLSFSEYGAHRFGLSRTIIYPLHNEKLLDCFGKENLQYLLNLFRKTTPEHPQIQYSFKINLNDERQWVQMTGRAVWSAEATPQFIGGIGRFASTAMSKNDREIQAIDLNRMEIHDNLTGLPNRAYAEKRVKDALLANPQGKYVMMICDIDAFKSANGRFGRNFGDKMLQYVANRLQHSVRSSSDIIARIGGDEFLIFLEYHDVEDMESVINRIFKMLSGTFANCDLSICIGVVKTDTVGYDHRILFRCADQALCASKEKGRGQIRFFNSSMRNLESVISVIDNESR